MEPLSGVASGMAVVSLSLQLTQSVNSIHKFVRNVKDAPNELIRLSGLMERLSAVLTDVHCLLDQQARVQGYIQTPSATISCCLQSCEESLVPLQEIIDKYKQAQASTLSTTARLKNGIKFSIKSRDIVNLETRIHHEISNLVGAVVIANATLTVSAVCIERTYHEKPGKSVVRQTKTTPRNEFDEFRSRPPAKQVKRKKMRVPLALQWLGLSKRHSSHYHHLRSDIEKSREKLVTETLEYEWAIPLLRRTICWNMDRFCGGIPSSFTVYPTVECFDYSICSILRTGTVQEFQEYLSSGALHPYTRDQDGNTLLNEAASYARLDVCHILAVYGLTSDMSICSPLDTLAGGFFSSYGTGFVDVLRYFLLDHNHSDNFFIYNIQLWGPWITLDVQEWLWSYSTIMLIEEDRLEFQDVLLHGLFRGFDVLNSSGTLQSYSDIVSAWLDPRLLNRAEEGQARLLATLVGVCCEIETHQSMGNVFLKFLQQLGVDVETAVGKETELNNGGVFKDAGRLDIKATLHRTHADDWILKWEYIFPNGQDSSIFLMEFTALTANATWLDIMFWPYHGIKWNLPHEDWHRNGSRWEPRFKRRELAKARKEAARLGQKKIRSKMPGAWIH